MRIAVVTLVVSLAATVGLAVPSVASEPPDGPRWSTPIRVGGGEWPGSLLVTPGGVQQLATHWIPGSGCMRPECGTSYFRRSVDGAWASVAFADAVDALSSHERGWDVDTQSAGGSTDVTIRSRQDEGPWSTREVVPGLTTTDLTWPPDLFLTDDDRPVITMMTRVPGGDYHFLSAEQRSGTWTSVSLDLGSSYTGVQTTSTPGGGLRFARYDGSHTVVSERAVDGSWEPDTVLPTTARPVRWLSPHMIALVDSSTGALSVIEEDQDGDHLWTVDHLSSSFERGPFVTDKHGAPTAAWIATGGRLMVASRLTDHRGWSKPVELARGLPTYLSPSITDDPTGNVTVAWADTSNATHARQRPVGGSWLPELRVPSALARNTETGPVLGSDASGRVILVSGGVYSADLTPPVAVSAITSMPFRGWAASPSFRVGWGTTWLRATSHDVRYRTTSALARGASWRSLRAGTAQRAAVLTGRQGRTYCIEARAHAGTTTGPWGSARCVTTPLDDRRFDADRSWTHKRGETRTRTRGATLVLRDVRAQRLALLVDRRSRGVVKVSFAGRSLGTFRLARGIGPQHRLIELGRLGKVRRGKLVVRVMSRGQLVRVEGVYAGR
ncbi:hypothetical protein GCM10023350_49580 [Nocardioides endophyticus]|uniref:Fibronectin type-III domain-containing protein n=1 Tax=Nocardioides endophyticus TaxID=1353775 RepID=A0ABP8ZKB5_9ACTN